MPGLAHTVTFNVGGKKYEVSRSLIGRFPNTILARMTSELWLGSVEAKDKPIFIERDGDRFRYCLDYMRDGWVSVPITISKDGIVKDLEYYGFEGVDPAAIELCGTGREATGLFIIDVRSNLLDMRLRAVCIKVAYDCVNRYLSNGRKRLTIYLEPFQELFKYKNWFNNKGWEEKRKDFLNEALAEFGLHTKSVVYDQDREALHITLEGLKEEAQRT